MEFYKSLNLENNDYFDKFKIKHNPDVLVHVQTKIFGKNCIVEKIQHGSLWRVETLDNIDIEKYNKRMVDVNSIKFIEKLDWNWKKYQHFISDCYERVIDVFYLMYPNIKIEKIIEDRRKYANEKIDTHEFEYNLNNFQTLMKNELIMQIYNDPFNEKIKSDDPNVLSKLINISNNISNYEKNKKEYISILSGSIIIHESLSKIIIINPCSLIQSVLKRPHDNSRANEEFKWQIKRFWEYVENKI